MSWELKIRKVDNGFILEMPREEEIKIGDKTELTTIVDEEVVEANYYSGDADRYETDDEDKITMARLLERVAEHFGVMHQKYDKDNLNVKFNLPGRKAIDE